MGIGYRGAYSKNGGIIQCLQLMKGGRAQGRVQLIKLDLKHTANKEEKGGMVFWFTSSTHH